jgi:hypothetical protein
MRLFAHALGAVFAVAFVSYAVQARGLIGEHGIAPATEFLKMAQQALGADAPWRLPSLFWLGSSDQLLVAVCWIGVALSVVLALGMAPAPMALGCWTLYLSLCSVSSPFLDFQWDILLLETALVAAVALPWRLRPDWSQEGMVRKVGRWLIWWLLFRLMFESGVVKLTWGDKTWLELRALQFHFETQCIPHFVAWYLHQLPPWALRTLCAFTMAAELIAPFCIVLPRRWRHAGAVAMIALQVGIILTGNFAFFNWLSIALCLPLFDDAFWTRVPGTPSATTQTVSPQWKYVVAGAFAAFDLLATVPSVIGSFRVAVPDPLGGILDPLRSFNGYGLFRVMTTERPEIIVEGSNDGVNWRTYEFRWKPGDVYRRPGFVAPHQPRLDWQMWFAALGDIRENSWFVRFLVRLLEGRPDVLSLIEKNPFPEAPPKYVRALLYDYHFTRRGEETAAWWKRVQTRVYCPPISLREATEAAENSR